MPIPVQTADEDAEDEAKLEARIKALEDLLKSIAVLVTGTYGPQ